MLVRRVAALELKIEQAPDGCPMCGAPLGTGVVLLREGEETGLCSVCGGTTDPQGRGVESLLLDGATTLLHVVLHRGEVPR